MSASTGPWAASLALLALGAGALVASRSFLGPREGKPKAPPCCTVEGDAGDPFAAQDAGGPLPILGEVPDFAFTERSGKPAGRKDLLGRIWVADFIFTSCAGTCPVMSMHMAAVQGGLREVPGATCVSFSVDPERDTLDALKAYADRFSAQPDRWWFLRGPQAEVVTLQHEGFKMGHSTDPFIHSERFALVDARGRIRGWYHGTEAEPVARLVADARRLAKEQP
jgi:protein SCO1/2